MRSCLFRRTSPAPNNFYNLARIFNLIPTTVKVISATRLNTFPILPTFSVPRIRMSRWCLRSVPHTNFSHIGCDDRGNRTELRVTLEPQHVGIVRAKRSRSISGDDEHRKIFWSKCPGQKPPAGASAIAPLFGCGENAHAHAAGWPCSPEDPSP
jgi:hypothetical protein